MTQSLIPLCQPLYLPACVPVDTSNNIDKAKHITAAFVSAVFLFSVKIPCEFSCGEVPLQKLHKRLVHYYR